MIYVKVWEGVANAMIRSPETGLIIFINGKFNSQYLMVLASINEYYSTTAVGGDSEKSIWSVLLLHKLMMFYAKA